MKIMKCLYESRWKKSLINCQYSSCCTYEQFLKKECSRLIRSGREAELIYHPGDWVSLNAEWDVTAWGSPDIDIPDEEINHGKKIYIHTLEDKDNV